MCVGARSHSHQRRGHPHLQRRSSTKKKKNMPSSALLSVAVSTFAAALAPFDPLPPRAAGASRSVRVHNMWQQHVPYDEALAWQRTLLQERVTARSNKLSVDEGPTDVLIVLQHPPVLTLGTASTLDNVRSDSPPFQLVRTERGGEVTYHGPGQLVLYPVLDLRAYRQDVHWYMRALEEVVVRTLHDFGLPASREPGLTGVWVEDAKACAIGVKLSRWISMHGLALNVVTDLSHFEHIVPCGIADKAVTSVARELQRRRLPPPGSDDEYVGDAHRETQLLDDVQRRLLHNFAEVFEVDLVDAEDAEAMPPPHAPVAAVSNTVP